MHRSRLSLDIMTTTPPPHWAHDPPHLLPAKCTHLTSSLKLDHICDVHPCEKVIGIFFQNQIWSRLLYINRLCLVCIKRSIEEVKMCQISKRGYQQGPRDETLKNVRCQFCDDKFGHRIMEAIGFFDYKMRNFTQTTLNFTNRWSKGVDSWFSDNILHKWYFRKFYTIK